MNFRCLMMPLAVAVLTVPAVQAFAQGAFPAPLPGAAAQRSDPAFPPVNGAPVQRNDPAFPPVNGAAPRASVGASPFPPAGTAPVPALGVSRPAAPMSQQAGPPGGGDVCMSGFAPLRAEAEKRGALIKAASDRHAPADEACKLINNFAQSELKMIKYVEINQQKCGIPAQVFDQLKNGHKNTEKMVKVVCNAAQQQVQRGPAGPSLSEVLGSSAALPEATPAKRNGGSTFDTISGNVLAR